MLLPMLLGPIADYYLMESFCINVFAETRWRAQLLNIVFFELILLALFFAIGHLAVALEVETLFFAFVGFLNYMVLSFRSTPIVPWDIYSIRTGISVLGNYHLTIGARQLLTFLGFAAVFLLQLPANWTPFRGRKKSWIPRTIGTALAVLLFFMLGTMTQNEKWIGKWRLYPFLFTPKIMGERNGFFVTYVMDCQYLFVEKPAGYSKEEAESILSAYKEELPEEEELPNVIVIMDEAFSDLSVLGNLETNEDYMPYLHSLMEGAENTETGTLHVSVKGGNTANTEFEFLTGDTQAFLPAGSIPYQQYIKGALPSALPQYLRSLGYETTAIHPYRAAGWNRDQVYPWLGFDRFLSEDDFQGPRRIRDYISDESSFEKVIEVYEEGKEEAPQFIFNVTMQNHGSYGESAPNFPEEVQALSAESEDLNRYLSLIRLSDEALYHLISYFKGQDEKTILVFFGDHQPNDTIASPVLQSEGKDAETLTEEEEALRYTVPYLIWANYDIEETSDGETSANYLAEKTLTQAGIPCSPYFAFLKDTSEAFPVVSAECVKDETGEMYAAEEALPLLSDYRKVQYYELFDAAEK